MNTAGRNNASSKKQRFLFDQHNFDNDQIDEDIEEAEDLPPIFSEEQLEEAKKKSYEQGKKDGLEAAEASREKHVADLIGTISQNFATLFAAEETRTAQFESEAVHLARAIFNKLFPAMNEKQGLAEIEKMIVEVLENQNSHPEIIIEVLPDYVESIRARMETALKNTQDSNTCLVKGNESLDSGSCHILWNNGGGNRHAGALAAEIENQFEQILADKPRLHDNRDSEEESEPKSRKTEKPETGSSETGDPETEMNDE